MQPALEVLPIPAFKDNYIWLIKHGHRVVVVDPGDAGPVIEQVGVGQQGDPHQAEDRRAGL